MLQKSYFRYRATSQFMMKLTLLFHNALQLRDIFYSKDRNIMVYSVVFLIIASILLQIVVGVLLVIQTAWESRLSVKHFSSTTSFEIPESESGESGSLFEEGERQISPGSEATGGNSHKTELKFSESNKDFIKKYKTRIYRINTWITPLLFLVMVVNVIIGGLRLHQGDIDIGNKVQISNDNRTFA